MIEEESDEEYVDDPIRLFDCEQIRVFCSPVTKAHDVEDAAYEGNVRLKDQHLNYEETVNSYKNNSSILPVTFFDIESNVELLNQCRPLSIKLVDCNRFPCYHKWKTNVLEHSSLNLNKCDLQEADCVEILASDANNDDDTVCNTITSEDSLITNGNKNISNVSFVNKNDSISKRELTRSTCSKDTINSYQNNIVKIEKEIIDLEDTEDNIVIETKSDNKTKAISESQHNYKDLDVDKINNFACIIDKAYKKLTKDIEKPYKEMKTENLSNKNKPDRLVDYTKISCSNLDKAVKNKTDGIICNNKEELLKSKIFSNIKNQTSEKNKDSNAFIQETQRLENIIENNNGSSSPLLPCPSKTKKNDEMNREQIISDRPLTSNSKQKKEKNVCTDQLIGAKRVIPHYHYGSMYATQISKPFNSQPNIYKKSNKKTGSFQANINRVNKVNNKKRGLYNECNQNKRTKFVDTDLIHNITNSNYPTSNADHIASLNRVMSLCNKQCYAQVNLSQNQTACNIIEQESRNLREKMIYDSISSLDATQGNKNKPISAGHRIPILLDRQSQQIHYNNAPKFPNQRVASNRSNSHTNDLSDRTNNLLLENDYHNLYHRNSHHNDSYNLEHSLNNIPKGTKTVNVYDDNLLSPSFYTIPLTPIDLLPEYQNEIGHISNTNFKHDYINSNKNIDRQIKILNSKSNSKVNSNSKKIIAAVVANESVVNQKAAVENALHTIQRDVHKYPHLKQCLERPSLLINKATNKNKEKRACINNRPSGNLIPNKGYSPPILPIPTYQKTFEILAKIRLYDLDRGLIQPDLSDNDIPSSSEKTAYKRKINDLQKIPRNITLDDYKKRMTGESTER